MTKRASIFGVLAAGQRAYDEGHYDTALKEWGPLAYHGHATAQGKLAGRCLLGNRVAQDYTEAVRGYRKAADQGQQEKRCGCSWRSGLPY